MTVDRIRVTATSPEIANDLLARLAPDDPAIHSATSRHLEFALTSMHAGPVQAGSLRHTLATTAEMAPFDRFYGAVQLDGRLEWRLGREQVIQRRGAVAVCPTWAASRASWDVLDLALVGVPMAAVEAAAEERLGNALTTPMFTAMHPVSGAGATQWRRLVRYVCRTLASTPSPADNELFVAALLRLISSVAIAVFPNAGMDTSYLANPGWVGPAGLRRAVEFIDAHALEPITLPDIACAAGTSGRAVQAAFRRHYALTPMRYLRRARLHAARRELQSADPHGATMIADIAARYGFGRVERFSLLYNDEFGEPPGETRGH